MGTEEVKIMSAAEAMEMAKQYKMEILCRAIKSNATYGVTSARVTTWIVDANIKKMLNELGYGVNVEDDITIIDWDIENRLEL